MRISILALLFTFTLTYAQEMLVEEEGLTETDEVVIEEELDLDALLEEADQEIPASTEDVVAEAEATADEVESDSVQEVGATEETASESTTEQIVEQRGPFVDLLGHQLYSLEMIDETQAQLVPQYTNEALKGKKVVGLYFSGIQ